MSYFLQQAKTYISMHIDAVGSDKFTEKKWRSEVRRGLTKQSYKDWAADKTLAILGLSEAPPVAPPAPAPLPR